MSALTSMTSRRVHNFYELSVLSNENKRCVCQSFQDYGTMHIIKCILRLGVVLPIQNPLIRNRKSKSQDGLSSSTCVKNRIRFESMQTRILVRIECGYIYMYYCRFFGFHRFAYSAYTDSWR